MRPYALIAVEGSHGRDMLLSSSAEPTPFCNSLGVPGYRSDSADATDTSPENSSGDMRRVAGAV